jgi:hypothetical protein
MSLSGPLGSARNDLAPLRLAPLLGVQSRENIAVSQKKKKKIALNR